MEKLNGMIAQTIGVDISKDTLDTHLHPAGAARQFRNNAKGFVALIAWLEESPVSCVVFEPTGAYHHAFERRLGQAGLPLVKVNLYQAPRFAEAIGRRTKTDAVDAAMLARSSALMELLARPIVSETLDAMKELLVARRGLVKDRAAAKNRDQPHRSQLLKRIAAQRRRQIERQLAAIDAAPRVQCTADTALKARFDILLSIPGIGEITALTLLIETPELGTIENKCAASLGLARADRPRFRPAQRKALYPRRPGSPSASPLYARPRRHKIQCRTGTKISGLHRSRKAPKSRASIAIMRKLAILANALLRDQREWTQKLA